MRKLRPKRLSNFSKFPQATQVRPRTLGLLICHSLFFPKYQAVAWNSKAPISSQHPQNLPPNSAGPDRKKQNNHRRAKRVQLTLSQNYPLHSTPSHTPSIPETHLPAKSLPVGPIWRVIDEDFWAMPAPPPSLAWLLHHSGTNTRLIYEVTFLPWKDVPPKWPLPW